MNAHHTVSATWHGDGGSPGLAFACHAPAESECHAAYDCTCETWVEYVVIDGRPYHRRTGDADLCRGQFTPEVCSFRWWFDDEEPLTGQVTFPVREEWDGDHYRFHIETPGGAP